MTKLFSAFKASSKEEWLAKVEKDLKGKPLAGLDWPLNEQLVIPPFAHADDSAHAYPAIGNNQASNQWEIGVKIPVAQVKLANQEALLALENGATAICFEFKKNPTKAALSILLKGIHLDWISTHFIFQQQAWKRVIEYFHTYLKTQKIDASTIDCSFSLKKNKFSELKETAIFSELSNAKFLTINARPFYKGKEKIVEELAKTIAAGNEVLVMLNNIDLNPADYQEAIQFSIRLGDSYFLNIAKIRALKLLWQQVLTAWGISNENMPTIEVHLDKTNQTTDENYNKIKATAQAMSAVVGGVKRLYIEASDIFKNDIGTPFAQRIALNIQHVLQLESYMDRVIDPSAGSYYIEQLTNTLAEAAWKEFQLK